MMTIMLMVRIIIILIIFIIMIMIKQINKQEPDFNLASIDVCVPPTHVPCGPVHLLSMLLGRGSKVALFTTDHGRHTGGCDDHGDYSSHDSVYVGYGGHDLSGFNLVS